jgi:radical SAM protein with 4Fe4S-binding SPASM domain
MMHEQKEFLKDLGRQTEIDSLTLKKVIRDTKELGTKAVLFIGGEPFLRSDLLDLIAYTRAIGLGTVVVTNGVLLNEKAIDGCFEAGLDWLSISIDAASEQVFSHIRGAGVLDKITNNLRLLAELKNSRSRDFPKVVAVCTIMNDNLEELSDVVRLSNDLGIERVLFQPVVADNSDQTLRGANYPGSVPFGRLGVLDGAIDALLKYKKGSPPNFSFIGNSTGHLKLIKKYFRGKASPKDMPCYAGYNRLQIIQEGKVYFCVNQQKYDTNFGDVRRDSLKSLWFSDKARSYRKLIRHCKVPCLQWCSYRDDFYELAEFFQKKILFRGA